MNNCLFCKIINKEIPAKIAYEDDEVLAFHDIDPQAPVHVLLIPKKHIAGANDLEVSDAPLVGKLFQTAAKLAKDLGIAPNGYRIINNCGKDGGQSVEHLHFHLLGGRVLSWPPG